MRASLSPSRKRQGQYKPWDAKLGTAQRARSTEPTAVDAEILELLAVRSPSLHLPRRPAPRMLPPPPASASPAPPRRPPARLALGSALTGLCVQAVEREVTQKRAVAEELAHCKAVLQQHEIRMSRTNHLCARPQIRSRPPGRCAVLKTTASQ